MKIKYFILLIMVVLLLVDSPSALAEMSSTNYKVPADSLNVGGVDSSSTNYQLRDTTGEVATGEQTSGSYSLRSGYQPMLEVYLAISSPSDVSMSPSIPGVSGGTSSGSSAWTVTTDNLAGYLLKIKASTTPSLTSGANNFADYSPEGASPDYNWSVSSTDSEFGFTAEGSDIVQFFKDAPALLCNTGTLDTPSKCWYNLSTSYRNIASASSPNHPSGTATTVKFQAQSGASHIQPNGSYSSVVTVTALAQ